MEKTLSSPHFPGHLFQMLAYHIDATRLQVHLVRVDDTECAGSPLPDAPSYGGVLVIVCHMCTIDA
jgi:hypothetical protein